MAEDRQSSRQHPNRNEDSVADSESPLPLRLDLGDDSSVNSDANRLGNQQNYGTSGSNHVPHETHRREDNPISFRHFLRSDSASSSQSRVTKPRVYRENRSASTDFTTRNTTEPVSTSRAVPELSSALPDFVQDHLVIEQCYLGGSNGSNLDLNGVNLPDFTQTRHDIIRSSASSNSANNAVPLDLPIRSQVPFPLDLPIPSCSNSTRSSAVSEVGNSKSLPDFLADAAVCTQKGELSPANSPCSELEMMRQDLEATRRLYSEQKQICESLNRELERRKKKEEERLEQVSKSLEFVEQNLETANRRALTAESTIMKLKQEIKLLTTKLSQLTEENRYLRGEASTSQGRFSNISNSQHSHRLAEELRTAASNAELSLRQLLAGLGNLRIVADSLDSMDRVEEKEEQYTHSDEDTGPAL